MEANLILTIIVALGKIKNGIAMNINKVPGIFCLEKIQNYYCGELII